MLNGGRDGSGNTPRLQNGLQTRQSAAWHAPSVFTCGVRILVLKVALRVSGFGRVIKWIASRVGAIPATAWVDPAAVRSAERTVATAAALYPGRALCLEQSLVLYYLLRRQGIAVTYRQGVLPHPFQAHAWIEYGGEVISDVPEHAKQFMRLPDQLP
jgi:hypothetical protein